MRVSWSFQLVLLIAVWSLVSFGGSCLQAQELKDVIDRSQQLERLPQDFQLVDGATFGTSMLYVPDVKAKQLYGYRENRPDQQWSLISEGQSYSGTFFQLGECFLANNSAAAIERLSSAEGNVAPERWIEFSDGARPNDLVVDVHGNAYVTLTKQGEVRRIAADGTVQSVASELETPNGIALSPDGQTLYVSLYRAGVVMQASLMGEVLGEFSEFATMDEPSQALSDGMCVDRAGNVYCAGATAVWIWNSAGKLLGKLETPQRPINCAFGGPHGLDLYISTLGGLYRQPMRTYGVAPNPPLLGSLANRAGRPSTELPESVHIALNQVYYEESGRRLLCDVLTPNSDDAGRPAIVLVHGGGWLHGDKTKFRSLAIKLAERGYVVMSIEYRLGHERLFPAAMHDCLAAVRFLRSNAAHYNLDSDRIAAVGGSAGGHMVGLLATGSDVPQLQPTGRVRVFQGGAESLSSRVRAAVVMAGPMQIASGSVAERSKQGMVSNATQWLGKSIDEDQELYQLADAYEKISQDDPPMLFITGSLDNPERDALSLSKLKSLGVTARQVIHEGARHGHWNQLEWIDQVVDDIDDFLSQNL
ncbi:MAG: SMP-30/gluconolactonase/LRE family protein [bacterium]|nr:SMP-30/gluconolactonase/LRE family protein [bacterium]